MADSTPFRPLSMALNSKNKTSYKTLGQLLMTLHGTDTSSFAIGFENEFYQKQGIFQKQHILNIAHSSMEPQRDYQYMLYISDIPGKFWVNAASNYPSFVKRLISNAYAVSCGTVSTAVYLGVIKLFGLKGKTGTSSPQQELVYRASTVTLPSRTIKEVETNYIGNVRAKHPVAIGYDGDLSCTFEEAEDAFILRQFNSWMDAVDEEIVLRGDDAVGTPLKFFPPKMGTSGDEPEPIDQSTFFDLRTKMKTDIELYMFRYSGDDIGYKIKFFNCYPKSIGQSSFSYGNSGTISYSVNFSYDYFKVINIPYPLRGKNTNNFRSVWAQTTTKMLQFGVNLLFQWLLRGAMANKTEAMMKNRKFTPNQQVLDDFEASKDKTKEIKKLTEKIASETNVDKRKELEDAIKGNVRLSGNVNVDNDNLSEPVMEKLKKVRLLANDVQEKKLKILAETDPDKKEKLQKAFSSTTRLSENFNLDNTNLYQKEFDLGATLKDIIRKIKAEALTAETEMDKAQVEAAKVRVRYNEGVEREVNLGLNGGKDNTNPNMNVQMRDYYTQLSNR
jgi:hypothetical protein